MSTEVLRVASCELRVRNREHARSQFEARNSKLRRGLSLVELMISLAITAMLLTAVAAAFSASAQAIEVNDRFFRATQTARVSMHQLITDIRRCDSVTVDGNKITIGRPIEMLPADGSELFRIYEVIDDPDDPTMKRLVLSLMDVEDNVSPAYTLARNLTSATSFFVETRDELDENNQPIPVVFRVTITLEVKVDDSTIRLSGSAVPRKAIIY